MEAACKARCAQPKEECDTALKSNDDVDEDDNNDEEEEEEEEGERSGATKKATNDTKWSSC